MSTKQGSNKEANIRAYYGEVNKFGQNGEYDKAIKALNKSKSSNWLIDSSHIKALIQNSSFEFISFGLQFWTYHQRMQLHRIAKWFVWYKRQSFKKRFSSLNATNWVIWCLRRHMPNIVWMFRKKRWKPSIRPIYRAHCHRTSRSCVLKFYIAWNDSRNVLTFIVISSKTRTMIMMMNEPPIWVPLWPIWLSKERLVWMSIENYCQFSTISSCYTHFKTFKHTFFSKTKKLIVPIRFFAAQRSAKSARRYLWAVIQ